MPKEDEAYTGIWHKRYYEPNSKMAQIVAARGGEVGSGEKLKIG